MDPWNVLGKFTAAPARSLSDVSSIRVLDNCYHEMLLLAWSLYTVDRNKKQFNDTLWPSSSFRVTGVKVLHIGFGSGR